MVLAALENDARREKAESIDVPTSLWVEHVLPQHWREHWPVEHGDLLAAQRRDAHVHRLGNLTLVTKKLNPAMSNAAWADKRVALNAHSVLLLNSRLVAEHPDTWNEKTIDARSDYLLARLLEIWPGPDKALDFWRSRAAEAAEGG
jgi:hypothetical protein